MKKEKAKRLVIDIKTKKQHIEEFEFTPAELVPEPVGVDMEKLKKVLLDKKIIKNVKEIEPE